jgi:hypothetical protein
MKTRMNSSLGREIQKTLRKSVALSLSPHNHLQDPLTTVQIIMKILNPTGLLKFLLVPVNTLLLILSPLNDMVQLRVLKC